MNTTSKGHWIYQAVLFLASQTISLFGSSLVHYAIMWHITLSTQSGIKMTIVILCGFLPTLFISPFAGVWADRYHRKFLIIVSDAVTALVTLVLALLFLGGYDALWLLFVATALRSFGAGVQLPAVSAFLPQIVPQERLTRVTSLNGSIQSLALLLSPMLGGALLALFPIQTIFFIDVTTAGLAIFILLFFLHIPAHAKAQTKQKISYLGDMMLGIHYVRNHSYVKQYFLFCTVFFFLVVPCAFLTPLQVSRTFGNDVWRLTALEVTFFLGVLLGGMIMTFWNGFQNKIHTMMFSCLVTGLTALAMGLIGYFPLYLAMVCLCGLVMPFFSTPATVLLQEKVEEDFLGRVFGVYSMITNSTMPLGMLFFGPLADVVQIEKILIVTGIMIFIQGFFLSGNKVLLEAGKPLSKANARPVQGAQEES